MVTHNKCTDVIHTFKDLGDCFDHPAGEEKICKRLIASLPPPALPEDVKQCVKHTHVPAAKSSKLLFKLVEKKAREHERQYLRLQKQKREVADRPDKDKSMEKLHQAAQKRPWGKKKAPASADGKATAKSYSTCPRHRWRDGCSPPPPA
ncbi:hypothetical protein GQ600_9783 [Phytophthora cactorum]|nr:hypothetical protein GQ600_9783 [Phytophthora cactorum]